MSKTASAAGTGSRTGSGASSRPIFASSSSTSAILSSRVSSCGDIARARFSALIASTHSPIGDGGLAGIARGDRIFGIEFEGLLQGR